MLHHVLSLFLLLFSVGAFAQHTLTVTITDIRSDEGRILVALYKGANTWLDEPKVYRTEEVAAIEGEVSFAFTDIPEGEYGIALLHDKDGDEEMSFTWLGVPSEAYGFSHIDSRMMREPDFDECKIDVKTSTSITIDLVHWL